MARIKLPGKHDEISIFDGAKTHTYKVEGGHVVTDNEAHAAAILASVPDSEPKAEAPPKEK